MDIRYVTVDLEFDSKTDLSEVVTEFGDCVSVHLNQWVGEDYRVAVGANMEEGPECDISALCAVIEGFSTKAKSLWSTCHRRVVDLAFESGDEPTCLTFEISAESIGRMANLGLSAAVTIYQVGFYSGPD